VEGCNRNNLSRFQIEEGHGRMIIFAAVTSDDIKIIISPNVTPSSGVTQKSEKFAASG
jgi:hypothetical protein